MEPGEPASVLVRFRPISELEDATRVVQVEIKEDSGGARSDEITLLDRGGYRSRAFTLEPRHDGAISELSFAIHGYSQTCLIEWRHRAIPPVEKLEFEHATYVVKDGGQRNIKLLAPWDFVLNAEVPDKRLSGSPNIFFGRDDWNFGYDEHHSCAAYVIGVKGRGVGSKAKLEASLSGHQAECELTVGTAGAEGIHFRIIESDIGQRAWMSDDGATLNVNAKDQSVARYLGPKRLGWPGQNELHFRTMLAEIIAFTATRYVIQKKRQDERQSASELFIAHTRLMEKWLPRIHAILVSASELPRLSARVRQT